MLVRTTLLFLLAVMLASSPALRGQDQSASATHNVAPNPIRPVPTRHDPLPADVSQYWYVPNGVPSRLDTTAPASSPTARLARGVQLINTGDFAAGLALVNGLDLGKSPLAAYAQYYAGVALTNLSKLSEAEAAYTAAKNKKSQGYLKEALSLRLAETALARGDAKKAVELLEDLADDKVASPDAVLVMLGRAAEQRGDIDRALAAYRKAYYDYALSAGAAVS